MSIVLFIFFWAVVGWFGCGFLTVLAMIIWDVKRRIPFKEHSWSILMWHLSRGPITLFWLVLYWDMIRGEEE